MQHWLAKVHSDGEMEKKKKKKEEKKDESGEKKKEKKKSPSADVNPYLCTQTLGGGGGGYHL